MTRTELAEVVVAQREWAMRNPRAFRRKPVHGAGGAGRSPIA